MIISQKGIDLIKKFEGFKSYIYKDIAGVLSIGYGHAINYKKRALIKAINSNANITEEEATKLLKTDIKEAERGINSSVDVMLSQGQFDALVSLVYNWGIYNFRLSVGLEKLNEGNYLDAANEFFSKEKGVIRVKGKIIVGLVKRRQAELELWNAET